MKLAVVPLPNERGCEFVIKEGEVAPPIYFVNRRMQLTVLSGLLLVALALFGTAYFAGSEKIAVSHLVAVPQIAKPEFAPAPVVAPSRAMVHLFDGSQNLKRGDLVMLQGAGRQLRTVAAAPRQAVLVHRGNSLRGFYMGGEQKYVVVSGADTRIVSADEIHAVVPPALTALAH